MKKYNKLEKNIKNSFDDIHIDRNFEKRLNHNLISKLTIIKNKKIEILEEKEKLFNVFKFTVIPLCACALFLIFSLQYINQPYRTNIGEIAEKKDQLLHEQMFITDEINKQDYTKDTHIELELGSLKTQTEYMVLNDIEDFKTIDIFYINNQYINTGDENLEKLIPIQTNIILDENETIENFIIKELQKNPNLENLSNMIPNIDILDIYVYNDTLYFDISSKNLFGSSTEETLLIKQIIYTFSQIDYIEQIQFLVDGNITETLMGHINIQKPLYKNNL